ncbi:MAG: hypothetical protein M1833_000265 [Piccolia ochrophora]|nr:MAG: hypothetical protein M1833_000265 [Piccolia ochrophora]
MVISYGSAIFLFVTIMVFYATPALSSLSEVSRRSNADRRGRVSKRDSKSTAITCHGQPSSHPEFAFQVPDNLRPFIPTSTDLGPYKTIDAVCYDGSMNALCKCDPSPPVPKVVCQNPDTLKRSKRMGPLPADSPVRDLWRLYRGKCEQMCHCVAALALTAPREPAPAMPPTEFHQLPDLLKKIIPQVVPGGSEARQSPAVPPSDSLTTGGTELEPISQGSSQVPGPSNEAEQSPAPSHRTPNNELPPGGPVGSPREGNQGSSSEPPTPWSLVPFQNTPPPPADPPQFPPGDNLLHPRPPRAPPTAKRLRTPTAPRPPPMELWNTPPWQPDASDAENLAGRFNGQSGRRRDSAPSCASDGVGACRVT